MPAKRANTPVNGKEQNKGRPSRRLLCCMLVDDRIAGLLLDFIMGWHKHAKLRHERLPGLWVVFSRDDLCAGAGLTLKQYRRARRLLEGFVHFVAGGFRGKRAIWMQPTALTNRFLAGKYRTKWAARRALEALQDPSNQDLKQNVKPVPLVPVGPTTGSNQGPNQGPNLIDSTHSPLSAHKSQNLGLLEKGKEKPGKDEQIDQMDQIAQIEQYDQIDEQEQIDQHNQLEKKQPPAPPGAEPPSVELEALWEPIKQHKIEELKKQDPNLEIDEDDQDFWKPYKQLKLKELKKDLKLYPELPIPKGCPLVHPAKKNPGRWVGLSPKVKADLYARFKHYLENWLNGKAGKHAASVYGFGNGGSGTKTMKYVLSEEDQALIDAEIAGRRRFPPHINQGLFGCFIPATREKGSSAPPRCCRPTRRSPPSSRRSSISAPPPGGTPPRSGTEARGAPRRCSSTITPALPTRS
jgi:hypothetical protein